MLVQCFYNSELVHGYIVQITELAQASAERGLKAAMFRRCRTDHPAAGIDEIGAFEIVMQRA